MMNNKFLNKLKYKAQELRKKTFLEFIKKGEAHQPRRVLGFPERFQRKL